MMWTATDVRVKDLSLRAPALYVAQNAKGKERLLKTAPTAMGMGRRNANHVPVLGKHENPELNRS